MSVLLIFVLESTVHIRNNISKNIESPSLQLPLQKEFFFILANKDGEAGNRAKQTSLRQDCSGACLRCYSFSKGDSKHPNETNDTVGNAVL